MKFMGQSPFSYLEALASSGMRFGLKRIKKFLRTLGDPQNDFPALHIAGTNGKGSVAAMLESVFRRAGFKVALYTSPHLISLNERFLINGKMISDPKLKTFILRLKRELDASIRPKIFLTQFEFLTAIAFSWFSQKKVDVAIIETGLGGRLDATNVMGDVLLSIITNISHDHTDILGKSLKKIAFEKAGIIKTGVPVITGAQGDGLKVIRRIARKRGSPFYAVQIHTEGPSARPFPRLKLKGPHQQFNAILAYKALTLLNSRFPQLTHNTILEGLNFARWPGRFEVVPIRYKSKAMVIILDGAHNPGGVKALFKTLQPEKINKVKLLFGVLKDKDYTSMIKILAPVVKEAAIVPVRSKRGADVELISKNRAWKKNPLHFTCVPDGLDYLKSIPGKEPILVTGSLYLVGEVRQILQKEGFIRN